VGTSIGRYTITAQLGHGGMGDVYAAHDTELDRMAALKFLSSDGDAQRLVQEAKAASALNHPNIVTIYDVVRHERETAIAMELVEGSSLRAFCADPQPIAQVLDWMLQIVEALAATHARGIVHGDLKPDNIMVTSARSIKILDFGLARQTPLEGQASKSTTSGLLRGTLSYLSPEQTHGKSPARASDIFSLGVLMHELLASRHPFLQDSPIDTAHAIAYQKAPSLPSSVPPHIARLVRDMLSKTPGERPTASEVAQRLKDTVVQRRGRRLSRRVVWTAVTGIVAMAAAAAFWNKGEFTMFGPKPLELTRISGFNDGDLTTAAISPDGKLLAYARNEGGLFIHRLSDGQSIRTAFPPDLHVTRIVWFSGQHDLLVSASAASNPTRPPTVWIVAAKDAASARMVSQGADAAPSPDGSRLALISPDGARIWIANRDGSSPRTLRAGIARTTYSSLVWSPGGRVVSYMVLRQFPSAEPPISQSFQSVDIESEKIVADVPGLAMSSATALPDGRIISLPWAFPSVSHGGHLIEIRTDPKSGEFRGYSKRPMPFEVEGVFSNLSVSADGNVAPLLRMSGGNKIKCATIEKTDDAISLRDIQTITTGGGDDYPHAWSADSSSVYFESMTGDTFHLFRAHVDSRKVEPVFASAGADVLPELTSDGRWLLFVSQALDGKRQLLRLAVGPVAAPPDLILKGTGKAIEEFRCGHNPGARCVIRGVEGDQVVFRELDALTGRGRALGRTNLAPALLLDWDLSPDGHTVALPNHDPQDAEIRLLPLDAAAGMDERIVRIEGLKNLNGLAWAADGKGLFLSAALGSGGVFVYATLDGAKQKLLETTKVSFAVPSPDGKRLVFPERARSNGVWLLK